MEVFLKVIAVAFAITETLCSIGGSNYMDPLNQRSLPNDSRRNEPDDLCKPLYWYPRAVPAHCNPKLTPPCSTRDSRDSSGSRYDLTKPGIRGLVSPEGGINIMPFSDAYSSLLEEHKQKMITRHMEHVLKKYGERVNYGNRRNRLRKSQR